MSLLTNINLPEGENEFFETLKLYFPNIYDVKYLMKSCKNLKGGLQEVADMLEVERIGPQHQAGSDSLLTGRAFFKMTEIYFEDELDDLAVCSTPHVFRHPFSSPSHVRQCRRPLLEHFSFVES